MLPFTECTSPCQIPSACLVVHFSNHDLLLSTAEVDLYRMKILRQKLPSVLKALQELHGDPEKLKLGT